MGTHQNLKFPKFQFSIHFFGFSIFLFRGVRARLSLCLLHLLLFVNMSAAVPETQRNLRACLQCRLIKTQSEFRKDDCENCANIDIQDDIDRVIAYTTPTFEGMIAMMDPNESWVARYQGQSRLVRGCYAISVTGDLPTDM